MANDVDVSDSVQSLDGLQRLLLSAAVDDQLRIRAEKSSDPVGESSVEADAETASNHPLIQLFSIPDVNNDRVISLSMFIDLLGCQLGMRFLGGFLEEEGLELVDLGIVAKILRRLWHILEDRGNEICLIGGFETVVVLLLCLQVAKVSFAN